MADTTQEVGSHQIRLQTDPKSRRGMHIYYYKERFLKSGKEKHLFCKKWCETRQNLENNVIFTEFIEKNLIFNH